MNGSPRHLVLTLLLCGAACSTSCSDRNPAELEVARAPVDPLVFDDDYGADVYFQAFFMTHVAAVQLDSTFAYGGYAPDGARSLKVNVPPAGSALGLYTGGVLTAGAARDMADFNALTFYARADHDISLDIVGYGNDNTGTSRFEAGRGRLALTGDWTFHVVPIPAPSKLIAERGMFTFAEGLEESAPGVPRFPEGYNIWFDEIRYAKLDNVEAFRASMQSVRRQYFIGSAVTVQNTSTIFDVDGGFVRVDHSPGYFDFASSAPAVATVSPRGDVQIVGSGEAAITATLEGKAVLGTLTVTGYVPPGVAAPTPTLPAASVISMFSDAYPDVLIDTWRADWGGSTAHLEDYVVAGDPTKMYSALNFVGITFETRMIDASAMSHLHLDVYAPAGTNFKVKLVSFPAGGSIGVQTPDLTLDATTTPAFQAGDWSSLDIPLTAFQLPENWDWANVGQLVLSTTDAQLALVDNVYWHE